MVTTDIVDNIAEAAESLQKKWIAIYISALAVLLAVCAIGGDNAAKTATRANIQSADTYAFYQAKNVRQTAMQVAADQLELSLAATPAIPPEARRAIESKINAYKATIARYESEPENGEGKKELLAKARRWQQALDVALAQDPYFDYAQALLQIAIVLASVSIVTGGSFLVGVSGILGLGGTLFMLDGFTLAVQLPFIS